MAAAAKSAGRIYRTGLQAAAAQSAPLRPDAPMKQYLRRSGAGAAARRTRAPVRKRATPSPWAVRLPPDLLPLRAVQPLRGCEVPRLATQLRHVAHEPGVHMTRDGAGADAPLLFPRDLVEIRQPEEIDFGCLAPFVPPSADRQLHQLALRGGARYAASTSSMTSVLSQFFFALTGFRRVNTTTLPSFAESRPKFAFSAACPVSLIVRPVHENLYALDQEHSPVRPANQILVDLGKTMEAMLTHEPDEFFRRFVKESNPHPEIGCESYSFSKMGKFLLRSQTDCHDPDLPGPRKSFDLKTRATHGIRMNMDNYKEHIPYRITHLLGTSNSFEREYYDLCRSAFLKYSFQMKIGNMMGVFLSYHNTREIFGYEFVSREEIEHAIFGSVWFSDFCFDYSIKLLQRVVDHMTARFPDRPLRLVVGTPPDLSHLSPAERHPPRLCIFVEPLDPELDDCGGTPPTGERIAADEDDDEPDYDSTQVPTGSDDHLHIVGIEDVHKFELVVHVVVDGVYQSDEPISVTPDSQVEVLFDLDEIVMTPVAKSREYVDQVRRAFLLRPLG